MPPVAPAKSFAVTHPDIASQLLFVYEKDWSISSKKAEDVTYGSKFKAEWICGKKELGHSSYSASFNERTQGRGCPTCSGKRIEVGINDLESVNPKLSSYLLAIYGWDGQIINLTAKEVTISSGLNAKWACDQPELNHKPWVSRISDRTRGRGCPTCANIRIERGINDFASAYPDLASELLFVYDKNGEISELTAKDISPRTHRKAKWACSKTELNHPSYTSSVANRTRKPHSGCPLCSLGKTEGIFREVFTKQSGNIFLSKKIPLERKLFIRSMAQIDMFCEELNLVIEYDGAWTHGGVNNPNKERTLEDCLARDTDSTLALIKSGYRVIRIRDWDRDERLPFLEVPKECASNLYQVTYRSYGKDRDNIDDLVKRIIEEKRDWFCASVSNKSETVFEGHKR